MSINKPTTLNDYGAGVEARDDQHDELVQACPECDVAHITPATKRTAEKWRCKGCGAKFNEPIRRRPKATSNFSGLVRLLDEMSVDEFDRRVGLDGDH